MNISAYDSKIFPLTKYKNYTYKQVYDTNDDKYFKYLISNFKFHFEEIYDFYLYLKLRNKFSNDITKLLNIKILLDTETTGFSNNDYVIQLSYVLFNELEILKSFNQIVKINPKLKINNAYIHGITNMICEKDGICINNVIDRLCYDLKYSSCIIGHNINFDIRMLKNEFHRNKVDMTVLVSKKLEDTMTIYGSRIKLSDLYLKLFNENLNNAHNAYYDVLATYRIYKKLTNITT